MFAKVIGRAFGGKNREEKKRQEDALDSSAEAQDEVVDATDDAAAAVPTETGSADIAEPSDETTESGTDGSAAAASVVEDDNEDLVTGLALSPPSPRSAVEVNSTTESMRWEDPDSNALSTILETSERPEDDESASATGSNSEAAPALEQRKVFGSVTDKMFDPNEFRVLEDDMYELYERQFLTMGNGRMSSMSRISSDDDRDKEREAIRKTIKYYGKSLLVLFRVYASNMGRNKVGKR